MNDMILTINGKSYKLVPTDEQLEERLNTPSVHQDTNRHITAYVCQLVNELQANGRHRTSETYRSALNSLLRYLAGNDIQRRAQAGLADKVVFRGGAQALACNLAPRRGR